MDPNDSQRLDPTTVVGLRNRSTETLVAGLCPFDGLDGTSATPVG